MTMIQWISRLTPTAAEKMTSMTTGTALDPRVSLVMRARGKGDRHDRDDKLGGGHARDEDEQLDAESEEEEEVCARPSAPVSWSQPRSATH